MFAPILERAGELAVFIGRGLECTLERSRCVIPRRSPKRSRGHFSVGVERKYIRFALLRANDLPLPLLRRERRPDRFRRSTTLLPSSNFASR